MIKWNQFVRNLKRQLIFFKYIFPLQNGNWADRSCDEKHGFICMKQSSTERTGDEVAVDVGCRPVSEIYMTSNLSSSGQTIEEQLPAENVN